MGERFPACLAEFHLVLHGCRGFTRGGLVFFAGEPHMLHLLRRNIAKIETVLTEKTRPTTAKK